MIGLTHDKEKTIRVWFMNIGYERGFRRSSIVPAIYGVNDNDLVWQTDQLCLMAAEQNDIVLLWKMPEAPVLEGIRALRGFLPYILVPNKHVDVNDKFATITDYIIRDEEIIRQLKIRQSTGISLILVPFAVTEKEINLADKIGCDLFGPHPDVARTFENKVYTRELSEALGLLVTDGFICNTYDDIIGALETLGEQYAMDQKIVIKEAYGTSGQGLMILRCKKALEMLASMRSRKKNCSEINVLVEHWYERCESYNCQMIIHEDGFINIYGIKRQIVENGVYRGSEFPIQSSNLRDVLSTAAAQIGNVMFQKGYKGILNIDSIVVEDEIFPVIEINPRLSLSTYISFWDMGYSSGRMCKMKYYNLNKVLMINEFFDSLQQIQYSKETNEGVVIAAYGIDRVHSRSRIYLLLIAGTWERINDIELICQSYVYGNV